MKYQVLVLFRKESHRLNGLMIETKPNREGVLNARGTRNRVCASQGQNSHTSPLTKKNLFFHFLIELGRLVMNVFRGGLVEKYQKPFPNSVFLVLFRKRSTKRERPWTTSQSTAIPFRIRHEFGVSWAGANLYYSRTTLINGGKGSLIVPTKASA